MYNLTGQCMLEGIMQKEAQEHYLAVASKALVQDRLRIRGRRLG